MTNQNILGNVLGNVLVNDRLIWIYTQMTRIREFEEHVKRTFLEHPGAMRGHTHLADGAEASIVGALATRNATDFAMPSYRCHAQPLVLGTSPKKMMAELYGRKDGLCRGFGGSMHLADPEHYFPGTSAIVGQSIAHAAGAALTAQVKNTGQIVYCFFGDGASKQGAFFETLNLAAVWKLPIVFILENNEYQAYTHVSLEDANALAGDPLSQKAAAFSIPGATVDGTDPLLVYEEVQGRGTRSCRTRPQSHRVEILPTQCARQRHHRASCAYAISRTRSHRSVRQQSGVPGGQREGSNSALPRTVTEPRHPNGGRTPAAR